MQLLIARHGNTFNANEKPRRVGVRTDLPLVEKGLEQAYQLGLYLKEHDLIPDAIYCSELQRTQQTAKGICKALNVTLPIKIDARFNEVDYGLDENQEEETVIKRIGEEALKNWEEKSIVPEGWNIHPEKIKNAWKAFAEEQLKQNTQQCVLVVTSNGIARFASVLLENDNNVCGKMPTGSLSILEYEEKRWRLKSWGLKP